MSEDNGAPQADGLSSLRDEAGKPSSPEASIPSADRLAAMLSAWATMPSGPFRRAFPEYDAASFEIGTNWHRDVLQFFARYAQGIEAASADETRSGSAVGESPVPQGGAQ